MSHTARGLHPAGAVERSFGRTTEVKGFLVACWGSCWAVLEELLTPSLGIFVPVEAKGQAVCQGQLNSRACQSVGLEGVDPLDGGQKVRVLVGAQAEVSATQMQVEKSGFSGPVQRAMALCLDVLEGPTISELEDGLTELSEAAGGATLRFSNWRWVQREECDRDEGGAGEA